MDNYKITENIKKICSNIQPLTKKSFEYTIKPSKLFSSDNALVKIEDLDLSAFYEILNEYMNDDFIKKNFTSKYIETKLGKLIIKIIKKDETKRFDNLEKEISDFKEEIKKDIKEYTLIFPIINLKIEKEIKIGEIHFFKFSEKLDSIKKSFFSIISKSKIPKKEIEVIQNLWTEKLNYLKDFVCAEIKLKAEQSRCLELGYELVEKSLDVLRLYVPLNVHSMKSYCGVLGDLAPTKSTILYYDQKTFSFHEEFKGFLAPFEVTEAYIKIMEEKEFSVINKILNNKRNNFENSLLTAIHWFGKSIKNVEDKDRFIYFCVALETLLIKNKDESIVSSLRERVAFVLEKDKERRILLSKIIRDLYDLRSKIIHKGLSQIPQKDMIQLHMITQQLILKLINGKIYENRDKFFGYLEELKYS